MVLRYEVRRVEDSFMDPPLAATASKGQALLQAAQFHHHHGDQVFVYDADSGDVATECWVVELLARDLTPDCSLVFDAKIDDAVAVIKQYSDLLTTMSGELATLQQAQRSLGFNDALHDHVAAETEAWAASVIDRIAGFRPQLIRFADGGDDVSLAAD